MGGTGEQQGASRAQELASKGDREQTKLQRGETQGSWGRLAGGGAGGAQLLVLPKKLVLEVAH